MKSAKSIGIFLTLLLVLALVAATFVACNGKDVTLSFDSKGGAPQSSITVKGGSDVTLPELETRRDGDTTYVFDGWSLNSDLSGETYRGTVTAPNGDATYYAVWARGYRLTLNPGSGRLKDDQLYVYLKAGAKIADAVKDIVPTVDGELTFSGWYLDDASVNDATVMPTNEATLVAKYSVGFSIAYFKQQTNGEYVEDESLRRTGSGLVGESASGGAPIEISGFYYNAIRSENTAVIRLTERAADNVVEYYYDIDGYHVIYNPNPPRGTVVYGQMNEQVGTYDDTLQALDCEFTLAGYRFLGWADWETDFSSKNNAVKYKVGDELKFEDDESLLELYAIWQPGFTDAIGGSDFLFVEPDYEAMAGATTRKIFLVRENVEQKTGEYDPKTNVFTFKNEDEDVILKGVLDPDTNLFYYYNETLYSTSYHSRDNNGISITIGEDYVATYTDGESVTHGKVSFDTEWGYYVFTSDNFDDEQVDAADKLMLRFVFEEDANGNTVIALQNMEEAGYYATATEDGYPVIYLDGLGSFVYYFDPSHPTYYDITDEPVLVAYGLYHVNSSGYYECTMYAGDPSVASSTRLEDFIFRILDDRATTVKPSGANLPETYELKEHPIERSSFYGQLAKELYLDGFGGGTYTVFADENDDVGTPHNGTYVTIHNFWNTLDARDYMQTWFIRFDYEGAEEDVYFLITQDQNGNMNALYFGSVSPKGSEGGLWMFDGPITLGGETYDSAFITFLLNKYNETMVFVKLEDKEFVSGNSYAIYAPMFTGTVTKDDDIFTFVTVANDAQMSFKFKEEKDGLKYAQYVSDTGDVTGIDRRIDDNLVVHPATNSASWTDGQGVVHNDVKYTYSGGSYLEFYTFRVDDVQRLYYYRDVSNDANEFVKITGDNLLDYAFITENVMFAYPARLLLADGGVAYIALPMAIGEPVYVGMGTYSEANGLYSVEFSNWLNETELLEFFGGDGFRSSLDTFHDYYNSFNFRKEGGNANETGEFYVRFDKRFNDQLGDMYFDLDNFKADGYSDSATYILDNGYELEGTFYRMEIIIVFEVRDSAGNVVSSYYLKEDEENNRVNSVSEDAGLYYFYDIDDTFFETFGPDYSGSLTDYIIYDGESGVTVVDIQEEFLENKYNGTMTKTSNWTEDFREYEIQELTDEGEIGSVYKVLLGSFESVWHEVFKVYDRQSDAYSGDYETEDYGMLHGNGYRLNSATYDEDGDGVVDYTGLMVRATFDEKDIQTHAYTVDKDGDVIVFTYRIDEETSRSIVFDIVTGGSGYEYLMERKLIFGAFAEWNVGERTGSYMYLDGQGNATLYDPEGNPAGTGTYELDDSKGETSYLYKDKDESVRNFWFAIYIESEEGGMTYFEYRRYTEGVEGEYEADDWSHLSINSFGEITYTDCYGVVYQGYYEVDEANSNIMLYTYDGTGLKFTFYLDMGGEYFEFISREKIEIEEPAEPEVPSESAGEA